jgi:uncharacterized RDD family membrane protein YckC
MVIEDFSSHSSVVPSGNSKIAPVVDRVLAFIFDVIIFTPVFGFILSKIFQQLHRVYFLSPDSSEFSVLLVITVLFATMLAILFQTLCLLLWGATPGKVFFKIKVVSLNHPSARVTFAQALLRSTIWCVEAFCLMLPWLEVLSQKHRRPLHDRAAETMVITQKKEGDFGPHWLETQFVRQFLLASFLLFFVWTIFSLGHYYKMAMQGDFRRADLDAHEALCPDVAASLQKGELRIDKALALYIAGQVSEDCLSAEAGFVMWAPENEDKPWAYLAQGFLLSYDPESQKDYFEKACESDKKDACVIANYKMKKAPLSGETLTANVLRSEQSFEAGNYKEAMQVFEDLGRVSGFESYVQEGFVKIFWSQNQTQKAQGAYETIVHEMDFQHKQALAAWMCHEELDQDCSSDVRSACEDLKEDYLSDEQLPIRDSYVALALLREKECRHSESIEYSRFHDLFEDRKDVLDFARAISQETTLSPTDRRNLLTQLAFRKEAVRPSVIRNLAMQSLIEKSQSEKDLARVVEFLKTRKVKDFLWVKVFKKTLLKLNAMSATPMVADLVTLPDSSLIATYHLDGMVMQGKALIAKTHYSRVKEERLPASVPRLEPGPTEKK